VNPCKSWSNDLKNIENVIIAAVRGRHRSYSGAKIGSGKHRVQDTITPQVIAKIWIVSSNVVIVGTMHVSTADSKDELFHSVGSSMHQAYPLNERQKDDRVLAGSYSGEELYQTV